jgi:YgiT-type zinc finger domain-containing protein
MKLALLTVLLLAPFAHAASPPISLSFHELVKHPAKYNGKRVSVRAYLVTSCEHCGEFFADPACARHHREKHSVAIGRLVKPSLMNAWPRGRLALTNPKVPNDGFVFITGTFRWNDTSLPVPKETDRVRWVRVGGFGWMGNDDKTITNITEYRPIGENIPAGIN